MLPPVVPLAEWVQALKFFTPASRVILLLFWHLTVDRLKISKDSDLRGHVQRVLRGLRHLQLHDLPAELPGESVPQLGVHAGVPGAAETSAPSLLLPALAHGRVGFLWKCVCVNSNMFVSCTFSLLAFVERLRGKCCSWLACLFLSSFCPQDQFCSFELKDQKNWFYIFQHQLCFLILYFINLAC